MYFTHPQFKKFPFKILFQKSPEKELRKKLSGAFPGFDITFTNSGRSAFQIAIKELGLENSEMLVPAYICDIFLPIFEKYNIKPIYLDIDLKTFNPKLSNGASISGIEKKITPQTKSILISHTYGLPNNMDKFLEITQKHNLKIIEDCAHLSFRGLPRAESRGDCAFFSFAKIMPTINGGMLISKNPIKASLKKYKFKLKHIIKFLRLFPVLAGISEKFRPIAESREKSKGFSMGTPGRASKGSLRILNWYLNNFEEQASKRTALTKYFQEKLKEIGFQISSGITYVSALVPKNINRDELFYKLRKKNIFCSRIWQKPIYPNLPNTAEAAKRIINFPFQNWFTKKDIEKIISYI